MQVPLRGGTLWLRGPGDWSLSPRDLGVLRAIADNADVENPARDARTQVARGGDPISATSHDIKTPLSAMLVRAQALQEMTAGDELDRDRVSEAANRLALSGRRVARLCDALVYLASARTGVKPRLRADTVDVVTVASSLMEELRGAVPQERFRLVGPRTLIARTDPAMVERTISSLLHRELSRGGEGGLLTVRIGRRVVANGPVAVVLVRQTTTHAPRSTDEDSGRLTLIQDLVREIGGVADDGATARTVWCRVTFPLVLPSDEQWPEAGSAAIAGD